jgi:hypothetical protein
MGEASSPYEEEDKFMQHFCAKTWSKKTILNTYV